MILAKPLPPHIKDLPLNNGFLAIATVIKKTRTKAAFVLALLCIGLAVYHQEAPLPLEEPSVPAILGVFLIVAGMMFRIVALGTIHKNDFVNRTGIYSLCRHPLYLGTILMGMGLCLIASDLTTFLIVTAYFLVYYTVTIAWEERLLRYRFGGDHVQYCAETPLLIPYGQYIPGAFALRRAMQQGALGLVAIVIVTLVLLELMARNFS